MPIVFVRGASAALPKADVVGLSAIGQKPTWKSVEWLVRSVSTSSRKQNLIFEAGEATAPDADTTAAGNQALVNFSKRSRETLQI